MKILKLRLRNINSLYGTWSIDFTAPEFVNYGFFAITGPTGSGKSTILDAICLALYAQTPRLDNRENQGVVSRGAKECFAELQFEADGDTYKALFGYSSFSRGAKAGQLHESYTHTLEKNGVQICDKTKKTIAEITRITGLEHKQFARTIILPQGKFDSFLGAGLEKSEILEQITGTKIYSQIAEKIQARSKQENSALDILKAGMNAIELLSQDDEAAKMQSLAETQRCIKDIETEIAHLASVLNSFNILEQLETDNRKNNDALLAVRNEISAFAADARRLARAGKAEPLRCQAERTASLKKETAQASAQLEKLNKILPDLKIMMQNAAAAEGTAWNNLEKIRNNRLKQVPLWQKIRELDRNIEALKTKISSISALCKNADSSAENCRKSAQDARNRLNSIISEHQIDIAFLNNHAECAGLVDKRPVWAVAVKQLKTIRNNEKKLQLSLQTAGKLCSAADKNADNAAICTAEADKKLKKIIAEYETDLAELKKLPKAEWELLAQTLEQNLILQNRIESLEDQRAQLRPGVPCPLCGALEHPFAKNMPAGERTGSIQSKLTDIREKLKSYDAMERALFRKEQLKAEAATDLERCRIAEEQAAELKQRRLDEYREFFADLSKNQASYNELYEPFIRELADFGLTWDETQDLPPELDRKITDFQSATARAAEFETDRAKADADCALAAARLQDALAVCTGLNAEFIEAEEELDSLLLIRKNEFGERSPDAEDAESGHALTAADEQHRQCEKTSLKLSADLAHAEKEFENLSKRTLELAALHAEAEKALQNAMAVLDINMDDFIPPEELGALSGKDAALQATLKKCMDIADDLQKRIRQASGTLPPDVERPACESALLGKKEKHSELLRLSGILQSELEKNQIAKDKFTAGMQDFEEQKKRCYIWDRLLGIIGGRDKFQRFVQGITLDHLLVLANAELRKLYPRYELLREDNMRLDIDVADHYQGGTIRPTANLSGGERFIVSFSLALALSKMAGEKFRIDSLFMDEGFGTLDSQFLQTMFQVLRQLRQEGKIVGIISHVSGLADEIPCNILVTPVGGGRSVLSGPGVARGADE